MIGSHRYIPALPPATTATGCELSFMMCIPSGSFLPVAALRIRAQPAQVRALEVETEYVRRRPSDFKQLVPGEPERFIS